jgi:hypothetical protein
MPSTILSDNGASSGTAGLKTSGSNDGILELQTTTAGGTATTAITIDTGQRSKFPTTIGVGGATPATSGSGISFPASASASSDANTLDDYEEGTFDPTIEGSGGNPTVTYGTRIGRYTKIGQLVILQIDISPSAYSGGSGTFRIGGFPFTVNSSAGFWQSPVYLGGVDLDADCLWANFEPNQNNVWGQINQIRDNTGAQPLGTGAFAANDIIRITVVYFV